jgi:hypothetical protein
MMDLGELEQKIRARLAEAEQRRRHYEHHQRQRHADREQRRRLFRTLADRLLRLAIRPRLEKLAAYFPGGAVPLHAEETGRNRCVYLFRPRPDFPAAGMLELALHHDLECQQLFLIYRLDLMPVPFPFNRHDRLTLPLAEPDEAHAVAWVESKMLEALDVCLRLQVGEIAESDTSRLAA